ncbi:MAG: C_GCAxxG_C_C family protein [Oscillospiraceae bacterium]|nr:C_GCAxxG_C_C family protein [Oscillospiraceae bacterium]
MNHGELAKQNFERGCNCAQAVFLAFSDVTGLDEATAMKVSASFGGGMGKLREVCGAVSGMFMAAGMIFADDHVPTPDAKAAHYEKIRALAARFKEENGSYLCRELLEGVPVSKEAAPEERTEQYYRKRPCGELCRIAAQLLDELLAQEAQSSESI